MEQKINLKKLEKDTAAGIFQTGIVEIGIGMVFIVSSLAMLIDDYRYYIIILFILPPIFTFVGVKYIANPRMGMVIFSRRRIRKSRLLTISLTTFLIVVLMFTIFGHTNKLDDLINMRWIVSGIIFIICIAVAYFMNFDRMYIYAFLLTGAFNLSEAIRENSWPVSDGGYAYLFLAIILIAIGGSYLVRFIKKYPLPEKGVSYDRSIKER